MLAVAATAKTEVGKLLQPCTMTQLKCVYAIDAQVKVPLMIETQKANAQLTQSKLDNRTTIIFCSNFPVTLNRPV